MRWVPSVHLQATPKAAWAICGRKSAAEKFPRTMTPPTTDGVSPLHQIVGEYIKKTKNNKGKPRRQVIPPKSRNWIRRATPALFAPVSRCVRFCREQREQTPVRAVRADLGWFSKACEGRKEKQDKEQASSVALCSVTSARSAGSCGGFRGIPKWGQNRRGNITSAVVFPESLLPQEKSRGHTPEKMLL